MQITLDITENPADTLRALGLVLEDPRSVIDMEEQIDDLRDDLETAQREIDGGTRPEMEALQAKVDRLTAQHETDTRLIEGLREQLAKVSPAPALAAALPPVRVEGLASEEVIQEGAASPHAAEADAGSHATSNGVARESQADASNGYETIGHPVSPDVACELFGCGAPASKDKESGGHFCGLHAAVPLSIRLEAKRAHRKEEAARGVA